ncbi:conserved hypothetical protein [Culex quinquefasciatus]|uniref:Uncharacterized protein n=1 Tax=Culex quinquefasciatus TaxID=7176 RepID=B0XEC4_CULQU|nr:conserved hypothetical protein [Culex quinquefasciatus]|eukprot:XP_001867996.1 conserved hypothetical protein [Culex quinquefasciatus]
MVSKVTLKDIEALGKKSDSFPRSMFLKTDKMLHSFQVAPTGFSTEGQPETVLSLINIIDLVHHNDIDPD